MAKSSVLLIVDAMFVSMLQRMDLDQGGVVSGRGPQFSIRDLFDKVTRETVKQAIEDDCVDRSTLVFNGLSDNRFLRREYEGLKFKVSVADVSGRVPVRDTSLRQQEYHRLIVMAQLSYMLANLLLSKREQAPTDIILLVRPTLNFLFELADKQLPKVRLHFPVSETYQLSTREAQPVFLHGHLHSFKQYDLDAMLRDLPKCPPSFGTRLNISSSAVQSS